MKSLLCLSLILLIAPALSAQDDAKVVRTARYTDPKTVLTVVGVEVELPAGEVWRLESLPAGASVSQAVMHSGNKPPALSGSRGDATRTETIQRKHLVMGLVREKADPVVLQFASMITSRTCLVTWNPSGGATQKDLIEQWATARQSQWLEAGPPPQGSIAQRWIQGMAAVYRCKSPDVRDWLVRPDDSEPMDTLAVFGGRCAVTETLQLRDIESPQPGQPAVKKYNASVDVSTLPRVAVKSHPFTEMARGASPAPMPLSSLCPADRFFAFFPQPKRIRTVLDRLGEASTRLSSPSVDGIPDYRLWQKYLSRLGLDEKTVQEWIEAGRAECVAFTLPDLFIRDAADITFLIQMKEGAGLALFKVLPETDAVLTIPGNGGQCHVARRGSVLIISTSAAEAALSVKLADTAGKGSLGASDEFRCMRQKLPDSAATVAYCYFSDPFIRRLTGPGVKIGQHRRLVARDQMESLTAAALLYQLDHGQPAPDKDTLIRTGYAHAFNPAPRRWDPPVAVSAGEVTARLKGISLTDGPRAVSESWGTLADLKPLGAHPVTEVTAQEAEMYTSYVQRYQDYWRRYFDPIALRLDEAVPGTWSVSTFILPLVDNSLYTGLKETIDPSRPAALPKLDPPPVAALAFTLKKEALLKAGKEIAILSQTAGGTGLTGRVALAFPDADPVLQLGGIGGMEQLGGIFGRSGMNDMAGIALLVAMLTRPLDVFLEVENEPRALAILDSSIWASQASWIKMRRVTREGENRRLYVLDFEGLAQVHLDVKIEHGWLHLSNHPWSGSLTVTGTEPPDRGSALVRMNPDALQAGGPAALFHAQNARRSAVLSACAELLPWMDAQQLDSAAAQEKQLAALGLVTSLPDGITFTSQRPLTVPSILTNKGEVLTTAGAKADPGILAGIRRVVLRSSFEEDGLRAELEWVTSP